MDSVAISDHGVMYGFVDFYKQCKEAGIKPILGLEAYTVPDMEEHVKLQQELEQHRRKRKKMTSKEKNEDKIPLTVKEALNRKAETDERYFGNSEVKVTVDEEGNETRDYNFKISHLLLLAKNEEGYKNLFKIASESQLRGFYYKPRVDNKTLKKYGKGIVATSACRGGSIPRLILRGRTDLAEELAKYYSSIFDEFYLEIQPSENKDQLMINQTLIEISNKTGIPLVCSSDAHYVNLEDSHTHDVLLAVSTGATMEDEDRFRFDETINYIMTEEEMLSYGIPQEAIDNTKVIADKCNVEIEMGKLYFPDTNIPRGYTRRQYIERLCQEGLSEKFNSWTKKKKDNTNLNVYIDRLKYELDVIESKGFIDYFLIVRNFINYAKENNIYTGPGRGSAAGSMASYCLGITKLDPIEHGLIFERGLKMRSLNWVNCWKPKSKDMAISSQAS